MQSNKSNCQVSGANQISVDDEFDLSDIERALQMSKQLDHFVVDEPKSEVEMMNKYRGLKLLSEFLTHFDASILQQHQSNTDQISQPLLNQLAFEVSNVMPLLDPADQEDVQMEEQKMPASISAPLDAPDQVVPSDEAFQANSALQPLDLSLTDQEYVELSIKRARDYFNRECGNTNAKKADLSDNQFTDVETPNIIRQPVFADDTFGNVDKKKVMVSGNVKALVPLAWEILHGEPMSVNEPQNTKYRKGQPVFKGDSQIFGVLTKHQVGHIPSVNIYHTMLEKDKNDELCFGQDTYAFRPLSQEGILEMDLNHEYEKLLTLDDYKTDPQDNLEQVVQNICTQNQLETFHQTLFLDLYRQERKVSYDSLKDLDKKYYIIPLKRIDTKDNSKIRYEIDKPLIEQVENIVLKGYPNATKNILQWLRDDVTTDAEQRKEILNDTMFINGRRFHSMYHFDDLFDVQNSTASELAKALRCSDADLQCDSAQQLLYEANTRFKSIIGFREIVANYEDMTLAQEIMGSPIVLLDPIRPIHQHQYSYCLQTLKKNPKAKAQYRKEHKVANDLTTSQGRPIFSACQVHPHYLSHQLFLRGAQLPTVLAYFERCLHVHQLISQIGEVLNPTYCLWATQSNSTSSSKKCYETLETYGDTILKLAGTFLAYDKYQFDTKADENRICRLKDAFVTNMYLFKIGRNLSLQKQMRTRDPNVKEWSPPFTQKAYHKEIIQCTGKNVADGVESLLGAYFMSTNLFRTLRFISDIQLVPLRQARLLSNIPDEDLTFQNVSLDLDSYNLKIDDKVSDIYTKYFTKHPDSDLAQRMSSLFCFNEAPARFANALDHLKQTKDLHSMTTDDLIFELKQTVVPKVEQILGYSFADKNLLLEALTHRTFKEQWNLNGHLEKLEVLGDALLDYIANSNLLRYTMFDRYNIQERKMQEYLTPEDFKPFDAHQAKSLLTKNDFLAKLVVLWGLQEYILMEKPSPAQYKSSNEMEIDWQAKKEHQKLVMEAEVDKYILYSSQKNFAVDCRQVELFEPTKVLGDVFEAVMGAVYQDAGIKKALEVYEILLAPFVLFVAKFSKVMGKEPKEEFIIQSQLKKIIPKLECKTSEVLALNEFDKEGYLLESKDKALKNQHQSGEDVEMQDESGENDHQNQEEAEQDECLSKMFRVDVIFNNNQKMTSGWGNTKKQAERNASLHGIAWLNEHAP